VRQAGAEPAPRPAFAPGERVRVEVWTRGGSAASSCTVEAVTESGLRLRLDDGAALQGVAPGGDLRVDVLHGSLSLTCSACVVGWNPPVVVASRPVEVPRWSRRRYYRVDVELPVRSAAWDGTIVNLSAEGCLLVVPPAATPEPDSVHLLRLRLPGSGPPLTLRGRVLRVERAPRASRVAMQFTGLTGEQRERIIRYVFDRERELLGRGVPGSG
jgi:hypothetical protein